MNVGKGGAVLVHLVGNARRGVFDPIQGLRQVINLQDHHVPAVAAAFLQQPAGSRARLFRRDDLQKGIPDGEDGIAQAVLADAGIVIGVINT